MKHAYLIIPTVILVLILSYFTAVTRQQEKVQEAHLFALQQQAHPYEQELYQLRQSLLLGTKANQAEPESSDLTVGFVPYCREDVDAVGEMMASYAYTPLVILDCSQEWNILEEIAIAAVERGFDIIPAGITFDDQVLAQAVQLQPLLPEGSRDTFLLRRNWDTSYNMTALTQAGYRRFSRYNDNLLAGVDGNDCPWVAYGFIRSSDSILQLLNQVAYAGSQVVLCIDFQNIYSGEFSLPEVESFLKTVDEYVAADILRYSGLEQSFQVLSRQAQQATQTASENARKEQQIQNRIEELKKIVSEIYNRWDED